MLELIVYPKPENSRLINNSPFCAKTEIFLKLAKVDFTIDEFNGDPGKFQNSKLPVLKHVDALIVDSSLIENYVTKKFSLNLDGHLNDSEKAQGFAFKKMLEEYFYWAILHERWLIDENWKKLSSAYFNHIPKLLRAPVAGMIRNSVRKSAKGHGLSRHDDKTIEIFANDCLTALSQFLGEKKFLLGEQLSSYDASVYAFVSNALHSPLGPVIRASAQKFSNLVAYDEAMFELVFSPKR